ncbi:MAG TPA: hypothetical protein VHW44_20875 [Pseudonocardiaceae bacterium]|jgi:hypothetical protein|nr:hypothetical protein [Pseudonocardiaceae bacterium]
MSDNDPVRGSAYGVSWEFVRFPLVDAGDLVWLRPVAAGEAVNCVAQFVHARRMAEQLRATLVQAGVIGADARVVPSLTDAGAPVVRVLRLSPTEAYRLQRLLALVSSEGSSPEGQSGGERGISAGRAA